MKPPPGKSPALGASGRTTGLNKATIRTLDVLSAFATDVPAFGVSELSRKLGMSKNMVYRALQTLVNQGYLIRDAEGSRYQLGYRVVELQNPALREPDLRALCAPFLQQMHKLSGETARLCMRAGDFMVIIDGIESFRPITSRAGVGSLFPLHVSPASRVLLAALPNDEIDSYIERNSPLAQMTPTTITDPERLREDVRRTRVQGYALGYSDGSIGTSAIAFPVWDADGRLFGSVVVAGPSERFKDLLPEIKPDLEAIMADLNHRARLYSAPPTLTPRG